MTLMNADRAMLEEEIRLAAQSEEKGNLEDMFEGVRRAFAIDPYCYELFYMLGIYYLEKNGAKAMLSLERAKNLALSDEYAQETDHRLIEEAMEIAGKRADSRVNPVSIVIVSYNDREYMEQCLDVIRQEQRLSPGQIEVIVVDNASTDGVTDFLKSRDDIRMIINEENLGFSAGCNIGYEAAGEGRDIFLLNNDAILTPNAFFWLRIGLYDSIDTGAVSAVSNNATTQMADFMDVLGMPAVQNETEEQRRPFDVFLRRAHKINIPMRNPYEERARLTGFAVLIKADAAANVLAEDVSGSGRKQLMDERYSPAYFEDDDLGMRLAQAGYRQLLCHNSFIYHYGGKGFFGHQDLMMRSRKLFIQKWGFDIWDYELASVKPLLMIGDDRKKPLRVLEVGCGMGVTLSAIKYRYPFAYVAGIEKSASVAALGRHLADILVGDVMTMNLPFAAHSFDYIIVSEMDAPACDSYGKDSYADNLDRRLREFLRPDGIILYD